jgi:hypothetical protein
MAARRRDSPAAALRFPADVARALAKYPASALVAAELAAVLAASPEGTSVVLEAPPLWGGVPLTAAAAAVAKVPLLCLRSLVKTRHKDPADAIVILSRDMPVKLFLPLAFETDGSGQTGAPIAVLDMGTASAAGLALNCDWRGFQHQRRLYLVDVVTGLVAQSCIPTLASWPAALAGQPPGSHLLAVLAELGTIFSARPAGANADAGPDPPQPFVPTSPAYEEKLQVARRSAVDTATREANDFSGLHTTAARKATRELLQAVVDGGVAEPRVRNILASMPLDGKDGGIHWQGEGVALLVQHIKYFVDMMAPSSRGSPRFPPNSADSAELAQFARQVELAVATRRVAAEAPRPLGLSDDEIAREADALIALQVAEAEERRLCEGVAVFRWLFLRAELGDLLQQAPPSPQSTNAYGQQNPNYGQDYQQYNYTCQMINQRRQVAEKWCCAFLELCFGARFAAMHSRYLEICTTHIGQRVELQQLQQLQLLRARPAAAPAADALAADAPAAPLTAADIELLSLVVRARAELEAATRRRTAALDAARRVQAGLDAVLAAIAAAEAAGRGVAEAAAAVGVVRRDVAAAAAAAAVGAGSWLPVAAAAAAAAAAGPASPPAAAFSTSAALLAAKAECERALAESRGEAALAEPVVARAQADLDMAVARLDSLRAASAVQRARGGLAAADAAHAQAQAAAAGELAGARREIARLGSALALTDRDAAVRGPALEGLDDDALAGHIAQLRGALEAATSLSAVRVAAAAAEAARVQAQAQERARAQARELEDQRLCIICMDRARDTLILPCGHLCLCGPCNVDAAARPAPRLCPMCRRPVQAAQRVFQ